MLQISSFTRFIKSPSLRRQLFKELLPHLTALLVFLVVAALYCRPVFENKILYQEDVVQWKAMAQNSFQYRGTHGQFPLWSNGMFSGMPAFQIAMDIPGLNIIGVAYGFLTLWLVKPLCFFVLACTCFYFLTWVFRINSYIGIIGSLAYAYATYNPIIIAAGHETKMVCVSLIPALIGSLVLLYEKKYWLGLSLTSLVTALMISFSHMQIIYYSLIIASIMTLGYVIPWIRKKEYRRTIRSLALSLAAAVVGILCNAVVILTTYDSSKESVRGGSELASTQNSYTTNGLSEKAAFDFSMYKTESLSMLVPNIYGGSTEEDLTPNDSKAKQAYRKMPADLSEQLGETSFRTYWGGIGDLVSGPSYAGAVICFLALLGCLILDNRHKWWILAGIFLTIAMSWGGYFKFFNSWLLKYLPMYNKFRAPSMISIIPIFLLCVLAVLTLQEMLTADRALLWKKYRIALLSMAGVFAILLWLYACFDYTSVTDGALLKQAAIMREGAVQYVKTFVEGLRADRQELFLNSILRSFLFVLAAAALIGLYLKNRLRAGLLIGLIGALTFIDVMGVDLQYLNSSKYQAAKEYQQNFTSTSADSLILRDTGYYRVFDLRDSTENALSYGAMTAYFHHSIGGYHAAKLKIYEDLIDRQLYNYPHCQPVINMLNTKYIILPTADGESDSVSLNYNALGPVWFVRSLNFQPTPQAVMDSLTYFHPKREAILFQADQNKIPFDPHPDTTATIQLLKNDNDVVIYRSESKTRQFAVFSEIYYNRGWRACIDNFDYQTPIIRTDYALRGLSIPAGRHIVYFVFQPQSYYLGKQIQWMANIILLLILVGAFIVFLQEKKVLNFQPEILSSWNLN